MMPHVTTSKAVIAAAPGSSGQAVLARLRAPRPVQWAVPLAWVLGVAAAFACYLELARTRAVNSDGASQALQAWDMLHGNLLLHGWALTDVSFYTTELPQYMLVELVRGLILDRSRARWYIPVIAGALLGWAQVADMLVLYIGVLPLALVCAVRVYKAVVI